MHWWALHELLFVCGPALTKGTMSWSPLGRGTFGVYTWACPGFAHSWCTVINCINAICSSDAPSRCHYSCCMLLMLPAYGTLYGDLWSGHLTVRLSVPVPSISSNNSDRRVCCWEPCRQEILINSCRCHAASASAQQQMLVASRWEPTEEAQHRLATNNICWILCFVLCVDSGCTLGERESEISSCLIW